MEMHEGKRGYREGAAEGHRGVEGIKEVFLKEVTVELSQTRY